MYLVALSSFSRIQQILIKSVTNIFILLQIFLIILVYGFLDVTIIYKWKFNFQIHAFFFKHACMHVCSIALVMPDSLQPHRLPGSSVLGILQERILEWVALASARGSFQLVTPETPAMKVDSLPTEPPGEPFISIIDINFSFKFRENSIETCILSYIKQIASPGSMHETGCSGLVHWGDPEGWHGERSGREGQDGEHMYTHGWFMWMHGKNHHNIVK